MQRGQLNTAMVWGVIVMLIAVGIGGLVYSKIGSLTETETEGTGTTYTYENSLDNDGTAYLSVSLNDELKSGDISQSYDFSAAVYENIYVNDTLVYENASISGSGTLAVDVASHIVEGTNTFKVAVDNTARINNVSTTLTVKSYGKSVGENVMEQTNSGATTVFPLLVLIVVIAVFVALIGVLKVLG